MTGLPAIQFDTYYHIYSRGINRENIFFEPRNYDHFLFLYSKYIVPVADTYAYCLLPNHFHILVRIRSVEELKNIMKGIKNQNAYPSICFSNLLNAYAKAINKAYDRIGSIFQHPYGRTAIFSDGHLYRTLTYIHQNPQRHGLIDDFRKWNYSSYKIFLNGKTDFIARTEVLNWFGNVENFIQSHNDWIEEDYREDPVYRPLGSQRP